MQKSSESAEELQLNLDSYGAEQLEGSGFENEPCDQDFTDEKEEVSHGDDKR